MRQITSAALRSHGTRVHWGGAITPCHFVGGRVMKFMH